MSRVREGRRSLNGQRKSVPFEDMQRDRLLDGLQVDRYGEFSVGRVDRIAKARNENVFLRIRRGFVPGRRGPFVSAKGPKTILAVACPFGFPVQFAVTGGAQTRCAQTLPDFLRYRLHGSVMPPGQGSCVNEMKIGFGNDCRV